MKKLKFVVSLTTDDNDYQIEQSESAEQAARKTGVDVQIIHAQNDAINQSTQVLKAIQAPKELRPDAIIFEPVGGTALPQVAKAAVSAGIGWVILNRDANYIEELRKTSTAPLFSVSSDHVEIGRIQGRQMAALLRGGGSVLYIQGPSENSAAKDRTARNARNQARERTGHDAQGSVDSGKRPTIRSLLAEANDLSARGHRPHFRARRLHGNGRPRCL